MDILVDTYVVEGIWNLGRWLPGSGDPNRNHLDPVPEEALNFDPDYLSQGNDGFDAPHLPVPLRATVTTSSAEGGLDSADSFCSEEHSDQTCRVFSDPLGVHGVRLTYTEPHGSHGPVIPNPSAPFDASSYLLNLMARYFQTAGTEIVDDPCLSYGTCEWIPQQPPNGD
jgi:hypothetical protein